MLSKFLLEFIDTEMKHLYRRANFKYYARAVIILTILLFIATLGLHLLA